MDTAERGRKSRFWRGVGICSTWHLFSSRAGTRTNVKLKKKGCVSGSAEVLMRRCWCSIKVPEAEKYVKLMRWFKKKEKKKKMRHGSNPGFSSWLPVKSKGVFISCYHHALSQRKWCECWDFLPIIVNLLQNYSLPYNKKYLGVNVVCWHYINKIYLNLKLKWIEVIIWEVRPKSYCAIVTMKQNPVKR